MRIGSQISLKARRLRARQSFDLGFVFLVSIAVIALDVALNAYLGVRFDALTVAWLANPLFRKKEKMVDKTLQIEMYGGLEGCICFKSSPRWLEMQFSAVRRCSPAFFSGSLGWGSRVVCSDSSSAEAQTVQSHKKPHSLRRRDALKSNDLQLTVNKLYTNLGSIPQVHCTFPYFASFVLFAPQTLVNGIVCIVFGTEPRTDNEDLNQRKMFWICFVWLGSLTTSPGSGKVAQKWSNAGAKRKR